MEKTAAGIYEIFEDLMRDIDLQKSVFSMSKSWVLWDMAKQTYLAEHPEESNDKYTLGNPMEDEKICRQISDRHFGWELYGQYRSSPDVQQKIGEALENYKNADKALQLFVKEPNDKGTLSSIELEVLGGIVRTCMEEKREAEQDQKDLENALINGTKMRLELARAMLAQRGKLEVRSGQKLILPKEIFAVHADIVVESGGELHLEAGTRLLFDEGGGIFCRGRVVAKGTEKEPVIFAGFNAAKKWKNITLEGPKESLLEHCVIAGGGGRFYSYDDVTKTFQVDENGKKHNNGGGLACLNIPEKTVLRNIRIQECKVTGDGGGIWNYGGSPDLNAVHCIDNHARYGGGIYTVGGNPKFFGIKCEKNNASMNGGGMYIGNGSPQISDCHFESNKAENGGGLFALTDEETQPKFYDNTFINNISRKYGGGIYLYLTYQGGNQYSPKFLEKEITEKITQGNVTQTKTKNVPTWVHFSGNRAREGGGAYIYHDITKNNYDSKKASTFETMVFSQNTPDDKKEVFRVTEPAKGKDNGGH